MASLVAKYPANASGYLVRTALYHLMNEGTGTAAILARLSGCSAANLSQALARLAKEGFVEITHYSLRVRCSSRFNHYSLTPKGIELALQIDPASVAFALLPSEKQPVVIGVDMGSSRGDFTVIKNTLQSNTTEST